MNKIYVVEVQAHTYVRATDEESAVQRVLDAMNRDYYEKGGDDGDGVFFKDIQLVDVGEVSRR